MNTTSEVHRLLEINSELLAKERYSVSDQARVGT